MHTGAADFHLVPSGRKSAGRLIGAKHRNIVSRLTADQQKLAAGIDIEVTGRLNPFALMPGGGEPARFPIHRKTARSLSWPRLLP